MIAWRVTYAEPCTVDGDEVRDMTPLSVQTLDGKWHRRRGSPFESWHDTEAEARIARMEWLRERWEALRYAERKAYQALTSALQGDL